MTGIVRPYSGGIVVVPAGRGLDAVFDKNSNNSPEYAPGFDNAWTFSLNGGSAGTVSQDSTGITFTGAQNLATAQHPPLISFVDNGVYEVTYTVTRTGGSVNAALYGATTAHTGITTARNASGTYVEQVTLSASGSFTNSIRLRAVGTNGQNSFKITALSIKRVG